MRLPRLTLTVAACVVVIDVGTKLLARALLTSGQVERVVPGIRLDLYYNHAGAGNALTGRPLLVSALSICAVIALYVIAVRVRSRGFSAGIGLLLGGGIGNLADRIFGAPGPLRGGVIDWLRLFNSAGSMNLSDLAINVGVFVLAVSVLLEWWGGRARRGAVPPPVAGGRQTGPIEG